MARFFGFMALFLVSGVPACVDSREVEPNGATAGGQAGSAGMATSGAGMGGSAGYGGSGGSGGSGVSGAAGTGGGGALSCVCGENRYPFGTHAYPYAAGAILPTGSQGELDQATSAFYDTWKSAYLKPGCGDGRYYVEFGASGKRTVSEAHGYGMLITVMMAGHDANAKTEFDGLFRYFKDHPSPKSPYLMSWSQELDCGNTPGSEGSATDGDLDIAYALLLADRQWGSCGDIDYQAEALGVIGALRDLCVHSSASHTLLGDWVAEGSSHYSGTRSSDFMTTHFRTFASASGDADWTTLLDSTYGIIASIQLNHSATTGLLPDFIVNEGTPAPAPAGFLEGDWDGDYGYNACRDPLRLGLDFLLHGDERARSAVQKMTAYVNSEAGGDPNGINGGYAIEGGGRPDSEWFDLSYVAPFGVGAMMQADNQAWLDAIWQAVKGTSAQGYYPDSLKMLSMLAMSGNWWPPEAVSCE